MLSLFLICVVALSFLWTIKLSQVLKKAKDVDDKEKENSIDKSVE